jgi:hypothetical protein
MRKPSLDFDSITVTEVTGAGEGTAPAPQNDPVEKGPQAANSDANVGGGSKKVDSAEILRLSRQAVRTTQRARQREGLEFYSGQMSTVLHDRIRKCVYEKRVTKQEIITQALEHYLTKIGY